MHVCTKEELQASRVKIATKCSVNHATEVVANSSETSSREHHYFTTPLNLWRM